MATQTFSDGSAFPAFCRQVHIEVQGHTESSFLNQSIFTTQHVVASQKTYPEGQVQISCHQLISHATASMPFHRRTAIHHLSCPRWSVTHYEGSNGDLRRTDRGSCLLYYERRTSDIDKNSRMWRLTSSYTATSTKTHKWLTARLGCLAVLNKGYYKFTDTSEVYTNFLPPSLGTLLRIWG
jgi:hypothetical protein